MNFIEKPDVILQIYLLVLKIGLAIAAIYGVRQIILIMLLLCNCRPRLIELTEIADHSIREEQGRLETNYLHFTTVDHLFKFDQNDHLKKPKEAQKMRSPRMARRRVGEDRIAKRSSTAKIRDKDKRYKERHAKVESVSFTASTPEISAHEFQRLMIDEIDKYSIESSPVNESSLLALSDSERSIEFKGINDKKIRNPLTR